MNSKSFRKLRIIIHCQKWDISVPIWHTAKWGIKYILSINLRLKLKRKSTIYPYIIWVYIVVLHLCNGIMTSEPDNIWHTVLGISIDRWDGCNLTKQFSYDVLWGLLCTINVAGNTRFIACNCIACIAYLAAWW